MEDINLKDQLIHIRKGKGQKDRMVPVNDTASQYVGHYIHYVRPKLQSRKKPTDALILSENQGFAAGILEEPSEGEKCLKKGNLGHIYDNRITM